ncbi:MAG: universal stress protein [Acidobacteria bacterium]|nr:universal stress protein [Acidobacteriota bacterium]
MKILLAVDGSACSDLAVKEVARRPWPEGSEVKVVSVAESHIPFTPEPGLLPANYYEDLEKAARSHARSVVDKALARLREEGEQKLRVTSDIFIDSVKDALIEEAERWDADLIVVGSHGYRGYKRFLLGSVSQAVAAQAKCSVEIVRAARTNEDDD